MSFVETDRELTRHSYYAATAPRPEALAPLPAGNHACDVAVIGGGLAGLSAAIELREQGFAVSEPAGLRPPEGAAAQEARRRKIHAFGELTSDQFHRCFLGVRYYVVIV